jgi:hypothetical protein
MKKTTLISLIFIFFAVWASRAQEHAENYDDLSDVAALPVGESTGFLAKSLFSGNYNLSFPAGNYSDFISKMGYRSFDAEYKVFVTNNVALGGNIGWYGFYEKYERDTYEFENGAITSTIFNYLYSIPLRFKVEYYPIPNKFIQPFIGLHVGTHYNERTTQVGFISLKDESWNFSLAPEVGVIIPFGELADWGFMIKGKYNYQVYDRDVFLDFSNLSWFDLSFGLTYSY